MNLKNGEVIELDNDNNEYVVVENIDYLSEKYVVLSTTDEPVTLKVCKEELEAGEVYLIDKIIDKLKESNY